jgi:hypothetical protein
MTRYKASAIHLMISAAIGGAVLAFMLTVWYVAPFFEAAGGAGLVFILLGVDVVIGPLITLIVFNTAKKSLKFDLTVVALLQVSALVYGLMVIFEARPVYVAFAIDRFELIRASEIDPDDQAQATNPRFKSLPLGRPEMIAIDIPATSDEKLKTLGLAFAGKDIHLLPKYYLPFNTHYEKEVARVSAPIASLKEVNPAQANEIAGKIAALGLPEASVGFVALKAKNKDFAVVVNRETGKILDYWPYSPWRPTAEAPKKPSP